jgi:N6-adenosine-specific RNA methylase IME4
MNFKKFIQTFDGKKFKTILADPPWRFLNRSSIASPENSKRFRYNTLPLQEICSIPVQQVAAENAHLYLWVPNALLWEGLKVMKEWGFEYKTNIVWHKIRKDGEPNGGGLGFYFRNATEIVLFGVRGSLRTLKPGRTQVNIIKSRRREHSRKPDELYNIIESCSLSPYLELFARGTYPGWYAWGDQAKNYKITWNTYKYNSQQINNITKLY